MIARLRYFLYTLVLAALRKGWLRSIKLDAQVVRSHDDYIYIQDVLATPYLDFLAGIGQLFTSYHHLLTRAPTVLPLNCADRFQCCQPTSSKLYTTP